MLHRFHERIVFFTFHRFAVVLNGIGFIRQALLNKSAQFAERVPLFHGILLNKERKG
jgi:hypothetical protein